MSFKVKIKKLLVKLFTCKGSKCTSNCMSDNNVIIETVVDHVVDGVASVGETIIEEL